MFEGITSQRDKNIKLNQKNLDLIKTKQGEETLVRELLKTYLRKLFSKDFPDNIINDYTTLTSKFKKLGE